MMLLVSLFILGMAIGIVTYINYWFYKRSGYQTVADKTFLETFSNKGTYGEYVIFKELKKVRGNGRIVANVYIKNRGTAEIDLILIHNTGFYVIECKNYAGWIFGNETRQYWSQMFSHRRRFPFFNPVMQNKRHISYLQSYLNIPEKSIYYSYIVFTNRCELKKLTYTPDHLFISKRRQFYQAIYKELKGKRPIFTDQQVDQMYHRLDQCSHQTKEIKEAHIRRIKQRHKRS